MGRPPGPPEKVRRNRVMVLLTDTELEKLKKIANRRGLPVGTAAHEILARTLRRAK